MMAATANRKIYGTPDSIEKDPDPGQFAHFHEGNEATIWGK